MLFCKKSKIGESNVLGGLVESLMYVISKLLSLSVSILLVSSMGVEEVRKKKESTSERIKKNKRRKLGEENVEPIQAD